jgi:hypothetical protein
LSSLPRSAATGENPLQCNTSVLANEWAARGINVNANAPGCCVTGKKAALRAAAARNRDIVARIPIGRWGEPAELAGATFFLASAACDYVHGAIPPWTTAGLARQAPTRAETSAWQGQTALFGVLVHLRSHGRAPSPGPGETIR